MGASGSATDGENLTDRSKRLYTELEAIDGEDRLSQEVMVLRADLYMQAKQWELLVAVARELARGSPGYEKGWIPIGPTLFAS